MFKTQENYRNFVGQVDNLELASKSDRFKAFFIDDLLISLIFVVLVWDSLMNTYNIDEMIEILSSHTISMVIIKILYQAFFTYIYGATIGKMVTGTILIDDDTLGPISKQSALLRAVSRVLSEPFYWGFLLAFWTKGIQTFHDKVAKTVVVYVK
jgi:uncharacterized RDD family membrane protein YckC